MSGSMPFAWIERPDGVKYRAVVNRKAPLSAPMGMMDLHGPLPKERVPEERGALVILQRTGDDFRGRSREFSDRPLLAWSHARRQPRRSMFAVARP